MADLWLQLIPVDPYAVPDPAAAEAAVRQLRRVARQVRAYSSAQPRFFHPGANWTGVACPGCGRDADSWWDAALLAAGQGRYADLAVTTPCCGLATSLNDLDFDSPAGFARFVIELTNPVDAGPTEEDLLQAEATLGLKLRFVAVDAETD